MTSRPALWLAGWVIVLLGAGDVVRYAIGYVGWGIVCGATLVAVIVSLWHARIRLRGIPVTIVVVLGLMLLSATWAVSAPATLLGTALQLATAVAGLQLATLEPGRMLRLLHDVLQGILVASLAFELVAAGIVRGRIFPFVPPPGASYTGPDVPDALAWTRGELFEGQRIQGIVGNANLLAMLALLALVLAGTHAVAKRLPLPWLWVALPALVLLLTRSATVLAASAGVAVVALLIVAWRTLSRRRFVALAAGIGALAIGALVVLVVAWQQVLGAFGRSSDLTGRVDIWRAVVELWLTNPVAGVGWVGYWPPWVAPFDALFEQDGIRYLQAHSVPIDLLMQLGVLGLIAWIAVQVTAWRSSLRWLGDIGDSDGALRAAPVLLLTALAVQGLAESRPLIELEFALLVTIAAGMANRPRLVRS